MTTKQKQKRFFQRQDKTPRRLEKNSGKGYTLMTKKTSHKCGQKQPQNNKRFYQAQGRYPNSPEIVWKEVSFLQPKNTRKKEVKH